MQSQVGRILFLMLLVALFATPALAQRTATVFFPDVRNVKSATGLVYAPDRTLEVPAQWQYDQQRDGILLSIPVPKSLPLKKTFVSGVIVDEQSQLTLSPLSIADLGNPMTFVPMCKAEEKLNIQSGQIGLFTQLVEIRQRRVQVAKKKLQESISPELFQRLQALEQAFDLGGAEPLSLDLPVEELAERLDILFHTVQRYELYKTRRDKEADLDARLQAIAETG